MSLIDAAKCGNFLKVKLLIKRGPLTRLDAADENGLTPLMWACCNGHYRVAVELMKHNANVNACTPNGSTALMWAASAGHLNIVGELCKYDVIVTAANSNNHTALDIARAKKDANIAKRLEAAVKERGADTSSFRSDDARKKVFQEASSGVRTTPTETAASLNIQNQCKTTELGATPMKAFDDTIEQMVQRMASLRTEINITVSLCDNMVNERDTLYKNLESTGYWRNSISLQQLHNQVLIRKKQNDQMIALHGHLQTTNPNDVNEIDIFWSYGKTLDQVFQELLSLERKKDDTQSFLISLSDETTMISALGAMAQELSMLHQKNLDSWECRITEREERFNGNSVILEHLLQEIKILQKTVVGSTLCNIPTTKVLEESHTFDETQRQERMAFERKQLREVQAFQVRQLNDANAFARNRISKNNE